jgi:hypothetical protein
MLHHANMQSPSLTEPCARMTARKPTCCSSLVTGSNSLGYWSEIPGTCHIGASRDANLLTARGSRGLHRDPMIQAHQSNQGRRLCGKRDDRLGGPPRGACSNRGSYGSSSRVALREGTACPWWCTQALGRPRACVPAHTCLGR